MTEPATAIETVFTDAMDAIAEAEFCARTYYAPHALVDMDGHRIAVVPRDKIGDRRVLEVCWNDWVFE